MNELREQRTWISWGGGGGRGGEKGVVMVTDTERRFRVVMY